MTALTDLAAMLPADPSGDSDWQTAARAVLPNRRTQLVTAGVLVGLFALGRWSAR